MIFGNEISPKGPAWHRLQSVDKNISGTRIRFSTPMMRLPLRGRSELEEQPDTFDLGDTAIYKPYENSEEENCIQDARIWLSGWNFTGRPILDGETLGDLVLRLSVLHVKDLAINQSLFTRSTLAELVARLHDRTDIGRYHKGHAEDRNPFDLTQHQWPNYLSPINSQWLDRNGSEWLYFETQPLWSGAQDFFWLTPIGHQYCVMGHFMVTQWLSNAGNPYRQAQRSPTSNYRELMESIMDTVTINLSEVAKSERQNATKPNDEHPLPKLSGHLVRDAKHTMYMWSGKGYTDKSQPKQGGDHRAPKEDVAAFIDQRIQPRPLPGCLAIGPASVEVNADSENRTKAEMPALSAK
ncbi:hypothetical protein [uncultured Microbulbifer sp.]|uniref:hypothetical protein n=1 Tax=uncultured Microbulbifer sp. TaxID=348147 RepID=UPI00262DED68|nr:hypothetical protein [uncultured Microbulbifer sp.]